MPKRSAPADIIVLGDGIAGRAMALALAKTERNVTIITPPSAGTQKISGGVQLAPNGWAALKTLGLDDAVRPISTPLTMMRLLSADTANTLVQINLDAPHRRPYTGTSRSGLMETLAAALKDTGRITWHSGTATSLMHDDNNATITLDDGKTLGADFIFGADGAFGLARNYVEASATKTRLPETRLAFRLTIPLSELPPHFAARSTSVWLGDGGHMVFYPLTDGTLNLVIVTTAGTSAMRQALALTRAQPLLAPLTPYVEAAHPTPLYRHAPLDVLRRGRIILCGDAAHPMPPHLAQGAGQSLVDAAAMKSLLLESPDTDTSALMTTWTASRLKATKAIQQKAERAGRLFALDGPMAKIRNLGLSTLGGIAMERELDNLWNA